jgi:hypothetical protein
MLIGGTIVIAVEDEGALALNQTSRGISKVKLYIDF